MRNKLPKVSHRGLRAVESVHSADTPALGTPPSPCRLLLARARHPRNARATLADGERAHRGLPAIATHSAQEGQLSGRTDTAEPCPNPGGQARAGASDQKLYVSPASPPLCCARALPSPCTQSPRLCCRHYRELHSGSSCSDTSGAPTCPAQKHEAERTGARPHPQGQTRAPSHDAPDYGLCTARAGASHLTSPFLSQCLTVTSGYISEESMCML